MAALSEADRAAIWREFMEGPREITGDFALTKAQLRAAFDAADAWADANAASFNSALPQPARGALTAAQKSRLLSFVILRRHVKGG